MCVAKGARLVLARARHVQCTDRGTAREHQGLHLEIMRKYPAKVRRRHSVIRADADFAPGLRPLLNLSYTCFLSAVLQCLIHNPLLKAYFLSDKHSRHTCQSNSAGLKRGRPYLGADFEPGSVPSDREKGCMCCEMDRAFEEVKMIRS